MKFNYLYNPFFLIAGFKSFIIGFIGLLLTSYLAYLTGTHFIGILNIDFAKDSKFCFFLLESSSHWFLMSTLFFLAGTILSKSRIRAIDVFGTVLLSRLPFIIVPLIRIIPFFQSFSAYSTAMFIIIGVYVFSLIWFGLLVFNAFRISCNLRNEKLIFSFIICLILAEIFSKLLIWLLT
jgi:hypothetical protein